MYSAVDLSKYVVSRCIKKENPISNLHLQKILYYIQKDFLCKKGDIAFPDTIEAWQFGPVVPIVYYYFCAYGAMPITDYYDVSIDEDDSFIIDTIIDEKCIKDPWELVAETHKPNGAWDQVYKNGNGNHNPIPIELIKEVG
ncbi:Uncharacterized phage-associated protein [Butyrivibrio fibrisolvens 16/4]|nr:Uncharacterized phage-associated protein [Butyrivibrio fibrisolvens 16/4]